MDSYCWMCLVSFMLYERIWQVLMVLLRSLYLLMMSPDCPLAIHHRKGEYILMEIGGALEL